MLDEPGLTTAAICGTLAAGAAAFVNVDKFGIHYSPLILPVHFRLAEGGGGGQKKAGAKL